MNTYTENGQLCPENNNFQFIYNSIINELIKLEKLSPTQSRTAIVESMLTKLCDCTNSSAAFVFELLNKNTYELKFRYSQHNPELLQTHPIMFSVEKISDWHNRLLNRELIIEPDIKSLGNNMTHESKKLLQFGVNSVIAFPISYAGNLLGYIRLDNPSIPAVPAHLRLMQTIGMHLGSIWKNIDKDFLLMKRQNIINENKFELEKEKQFLDVLCRDYTSVFYVDLISGTGEPFKLDNIANAATFISQNDSKPLDYDQTVQLYLENYVAPESSSFFKQTMAIENLKKELKYKERFVFRYRSIPNLLRQQYFETLVVKISATDLDYKILLVY